MAIGADTRCSRHGRIRHPRCAAGRRLVDRLNFGKVNFRVSIGMAEEGGFIYANEPYPAIPTIMRDERVRQECGSVKEDWEALGG